MSSANKISAGGSRTECLHAHSKLHHYVGRFTTAGAAAPTGCKGKGVVSIRRTAVGKYVVTLNRAFKEGLALKAWLVQAANGNDVAFAELATLSLGSMRAGASFRITTQSVAGTDADLTGPEVHFEAWMSDEATPATHIAASSV